MASSVRPAPLACTECRGKHLKCNGGSPRCGRCTADGLRCVYRPSRRGYGRKNKQGRPGDATASRPTSRSDAVTSLTPVSEDSAIAGGAWPVFGSQYPSSGPTSGSSISRRLDVCEASQVANTNCAAVQASLDLSPIEKDILVRSYYANFHPSHPLLVPRSFFTQQQYPDYLQWVVYFIAHHYVAQYSGNSDIQRTVEIMLTPETDEETVSRVQALVLYSIALHSLHRAHEALECINRAGQLADAMDLYHPEFAPLNAVKNSVQDESIRRTWWELHIVETYFAALHRRPSLLSKINRLSPFLPSSEDSYNSGTCDPVLLLFSEFENRVFARETSQRHYPTYCYRIEAIRLIRRVLSLYESEDTHTALDEYEAVCNAIASWKYYLPTTGIRVLDDFGEIDPLLFQARFFVHTGSILLHFPRSDLPPTVPSAADIACVKGHTQSLSHYSQSTVKAIEASKEISNLAANLSSTDFCSPFFICAVILACIVQLAASIIHRNAADGSFRPQYRDRVILLLGVLTEMGRRWAVARNALEPLKLVADRIFGISAVDAQTRPASSSDQSQSQIEFGSPTDVHAGIPWFDLFSVDELMSDFMSTDPSSGFLEATIS